MTGNRIKSENECFHPVADKPFNKEEEGSRRRFNREIIYHLKSTKQILHSIDNPYENNMA